MSHYRSSYTEVQNSLEISQADWCRGRRSRKRVKTNPFPFTILPSSVHIQYLPVFLQWQEIRHSQEVVQNVHNMEVQASLKDRKYVTKYLNRSYMKIIS